MDQKPQEKVPFTTAVQKALEDAAKSCQRELTTMVALGPSSIPPSQPPSEYAVSPSVEHEEGEIVDDQHHHTEEESFNEEERSFNDIDKTEQDIMHEWAPLVRRPNYATGSSLSGKSLNYFVFLPIDGPETTGESSLHHGRPEGLGGCRKVVPA